MGTSVSPKEGFALNQYNIKIFDTCYISFNYSKYRQMSTQQYPGNPDIISKLWWQTSVVQTDIKLWWQTWSSCVDRHQVVWQTSSCEDRHHTTASDVMNTASSWWRTASDVNRNCVYHVFTFTIRSIETRSTLEGHNNNGRGRYQGRSTKRTNISVWKFHEPSLVKQFHEPVSPNEGFTHAKLCLRTS